MTIRFACPTCSRRYDVPDAAAGKRTKCPACGEKLVVPGSSPEPPCSKTGLVTAQPASLRPEIMPNGGGPGPAQGGSRKHLRAWYVGVPGLALLAGLSVAGLAALKGTRDQKLNSAPATTVPAETGVRPDETTERLLRSAEQAVAQHHAAQAQLFLERYLASPRASQIDRATLLLSQLQLATSDDKAATFLMTLSDAELASLEPGIASRETPGRVQAEVNRVNDSHLRAVYQTTLCRNQPREKARREQVRQHEEQRAIALRQEQEEADRRRQEQAEKLRREQEAKLAEERGRPLRVAVDSAGKERYRVLSRTLVNETNGCLRNLRASVVKGQLVLEFDVAGAGWPAFTVYKWRNSVLQQRPVVAPLLVRLFDENGEYLTHFVTQEVFTPSKDGYAHWKKQLEEVFESPDGRLLLLGLSGNRLVYPVNQRDLSFVRSVEVGFFDMDDALGFPR